MSGGQVTTASAGDIIRGEFSEGDAITFRAYVTDEDGAALVPSDFTAGQASLFVYQNSGATPTTAVYSQLLLGPSNSLIFTPLRTTGWLRGGAGYNFEYELSDGSFQTSGGITYRFEFQLARSSSHVRIAYELLCRGGYGL